MRWSGWGEDSHATELPPQADGFLAEEIGADPQLRTPPVRQEEVRLPDPELRKKARSALESAVGAEHVRDDREARVLHAAGKSYPDLVRLRAGEPDGAPDAVVYPGSHEDVGQVLEECARAGVAVVPFGGGTSVVGGVEPLRGSFGAVISLDLDRLSGLGELDERSLTATLGPGTRGPQAEAVLNARGFTLGHFPQSYEYASIGGYVATRSAGQASTGYGRIDELVLGLRLVAPSGSFDLPPLPASAAGPQLRELLVGSEGTLGVITSASLKVRRAPERSRFEGWFFRSFAEGAEALRVLEQERSAPDVARLSDEAETRMSLELAGMEGLKARAGQAYLRARGYDRGCLVIAGWQGDRDDVDRRRRVSTALLGANDGVALGQGPGRSWAAARFHGPYLRDALLDRGVFVETLETAAQWSDVERVHSAVGDALREAMAAQGTPALVLCHISHLYPSGCSLYFTWIARQVAGNTGERIAQWRAAKTAACDTILDSGGTLTHHHAVGRDHAPWLPREIGDSGIAALRAVKAELDPAGIMNPGKLLGPEG